MNSSSGSGPAPAAGTPTTATAGISVNIPYPLYGLNSGDNLVHFESDASFMSAFGQLGPSLLRYPVGKSANWFDLSTGFLLTNPNPVQSIDESHSSRQTAVDFSGSGAMEDLPEASFMAETL